MKALSDKALKCLHRLAEADVIFWLMPPLMILLTYGTIAQRWMGLYGALKTYFSSFYFFAGPIPLPGGFTLLGIMSFCLLIKFLLKSTWTRAKAGINLAHLGALTLLIGGLVTALYAKESYMLIPEKGQTPYIYDYHKHELLIFKNTQQLMSAPYSTLEKEIFEQAPFKIKVLEKFENVDILPRDEHIDANTTYQGMARFMHLTAKKSEKEPEENIAGLTLSIENPYNEEQNGTYIAFSGMPNPIALSGENAEGEYKIIFGKAQQRLPFTLTLVDFVKDSYEGMDMAKSYHSDVIVTDGDVSWPVRIEMNAPLRYRGYTFYQSSFQQGENEQISILAVVKNPGWLLPYFGTLIITAGLIMHLFILIYRRRKKT